LPLAHPPPHPLHRVLKRSRRGSSSSSSSSSGGLFGAKRTPAPAAPARRAPPPTAPAASAHPPAPMQSHAPAPSGGGGMLSGMGSTIMQGMAFGTGSAIAHRAVGAVANSFGGGGDDAPAVDQQQVAAAPAMGQQQVQGPCASDKEMFFDCLKQNKGDQDSCSFLYQQLQSCQRNETTFG